MGSMTLDCFLIRPIQRISQYLLLLNDIFEELKHLEKIKSHKREIATICKVEKRMNKFVDGINEALYLRDIMGLEDNDYKIEIITLDNLEVNEKV